MTHTQIVSAIGGAFLTGVFFGLFIAALMGTNREV